MKVEIRRARVADAKAITDIIQLAFQDEADLLQVQNQLILSNTIIDVAVTNGQVVGFVENFVTRSATNELRLELDLLAVHPSQHGNGVGRKLIESTIELTQQLKLDYLRALIATHNAPIQHLCDGYEFIQDEHESGLYISHSGGEDNDYCTNVESHLIQVNTLTYDGLWLEGHLSPMAISNAKTIVSQRHLDIIGVVFPKKDVKGIQLLTDNAFQYVGDYHRWTLSL